MMGMLIIRWPLLLMSLIGILAGSCRKAFLSKRPSSNLLIPTSTTVLQELLDNTQVMNVTPALGEVSADNYYLPYSTWLQLDTKEYNAYIWSPDLYQGQGMVSDWDIPYQQVFYANSVLEGLATIQPDSTNQSEWNTLKGWALFSRAYAFFNLAELFAKPYDSATAANDPGIPIRLTSDINQTTTRSSIEATYDQILSDLGIAEELLPAGIQANNLNRPCRLAAQALFARIYLSVRDYKDAGLFADSVLKSYPFLLDYNSLNTAALIPVPNNMPEILYQSNMPQPGSGNILQGIICTGCIIDTALMSSYAPNDLRRSIYYWQRGTDTFILKGSYAGTVFPFSGLATDELYLIRSECQARLGDWQTAMVGIDSLLVHRWRTHSFTPTAVSGPGEALDTILSERRKELAFRGLRWPDLRRLNQENYGITLYRVLGSSAHAQSYRLPPGSSLYTMPIPPDVIQFSQIQQNPR